MAKSMKDVPHRLRLLWSRALSRLPYVGIPFPVRWLADSDDVYDVKMSDFWGKEDEQLREGAAICWSRWRVVLDGVVIEVYDVFYTGREIEGICRHGAWAFCDDPETGKEWAMHLLVAGHISDEYDEVSDSYHEGTPKVFYDFLDHAGEFALLRAPLIKPHLADMQDEDEDKEEEDGCAVEKEALVEEILDDLHL